MEAGGLGPDHGRIGPHIPPGHSHMATPHHASAWPRPPEKRPRLATPLATSSHPGRLANDRPIPGQARPSPAPQLQPLPA